jgi:uncharacterized membrane protein YhhN
MNISPMAVLRWHAMKAIDRAMLIVSIVCGVSYLLAPFFLAEQIKTYWPLNATIKGLAVSPLAAIAYGLVRGRDGKLLCTALVFSSFGDIFLALRNGNYFVFGLLSFLVAHLFFIALWVRNWPQPLQANRAQKLLLAALLFFLLTMLWWLLPIPGLSLPVAVYMCVLTTMVMTAALTNLKSSWVICGAILFLLSDTIIALSTFKQVVGGKLAGLLIWSTYYLAQYFIALGFIAAQRSQAATARRDNPLPIDAAARTQ